MHESKWKVFPEILVFRAISQPQEEGRHPNSQHERSVDPVTPAAGAKLYARQPSRSSEWLLYVGRPQARRTHLS